MTEQEAIKQLRTMYPKTSRLVDGRYKGGFDDHNSKAGASLDIATEALEKQIPKNPIELDKDGEYCKCPICDEYVVDFLGCRMKYCRSCGQALKWESEVEE